MVNRRVDTHPRTLTRNIWRGLLSASEQEIHAGIDFYPGAHGLCRLFALAHQTTPQHVAGIYAALSPMNTWDTNVANVLDVLRLGWNSVVNTTHVNHWKALAIYHGANPLDVLRGRKVRAFYSAIANPDDTLPVPVDRHLVCLALGVKISSNRELSAYVGDRALYAKIEKAYVDLGKREKMGNRLASIAWFVQRRVEGGQLPILQPSRIVCCSEPMYSHGHKPRRFVCKLCGKSISQKQLEYGTLRNSKCVPIAYLDGFPITIDTSGRKRIYLGKRHEFANGAGFNYLSRYLVMKELQRKLRTDEHVDHKNLDKLDDRLENFDLLLAETHGRRHVYIAELAGGRGSDGRFREYETPIEIR